MARFTRSFHPLGVPPSTPDVPRAIPVEVWAEPDAGEAPFVDILATAKTSIRLMVHRIGPGGVLDTLWRKAASGVDVRVILDSSGPAQNQQYLTLLGMAGARVRWKSPSFANMHAKVFVVDGSVAVVSTGNYRLDFIHSQRNFAVLDRDPADLVTLVALFDADWDRVPPDLSCTRLLIAPENARQRILDHIGGTERSIDIEAVELSDEEVRHAVVAAKDRGARVRVILASPSSVIANASAAAYLGSRGIPVRYLVFPSIHANTILVDGARAFLGSQTLCSNSLDKNRGVGLIVNEPYGILPIHGAFEQDWDVSTRFPLAATKALP